jgi:hypothetical protein
VLLTASYDLTLVFSKSETITDNAVLALKF